ncbi:MAG: hypothetical protein J7J76_09080 [Candidatus Latescibacteria bacterium]|nr:hypothetical protein [Candidatus Latescibacterota bacterium]
MGDQKRYDISEVSLKPSLLTVIVSPDSGRYVVKCPGLDLATEMDTPQEAVEAIVQMLKEYAEDYH